MWRKRTWLKFCSQLSYKSYSEMNYEYSVYNVSRKNLSYVIFVYCYIDCMVTRLIYILVGRAFGLEPQDKKKKY